MDPSKQEVLRDAYEQWLTHPVTNEFRKVLNRHKERFIEGLVKSAGDRNVTDSQIRLLAQGLATVDATQKLTFDYDTFVNNLTK